MEHTHQSGMKGYLFGFISSICLTLVAYFCVIGKVLPPAGLIVTVVVLGLVQALIQLIFFLYLGKEDKPRQNLLVFILMIIILSIVIGGTLWIMYSLNLRVMPDMKM